MRAAAARADDLALLERGVGHRRPPSDRPSRPHATSWAGFSPRAHHTPRPETSRRVAASPPLTLLLPTPKRVPTTSPLASSAPRPCPRRVPRVDLGSFNDCHHCHHMPRVVLRGTSTATAPKPRLLDSCAAAVYAPALRRAATRVGPSLPRPATFASRATRPNVDYIYAAASAATRTATLVAPAPRLSSARTLSPFFVASRGRLARLHHLAIASIAPRHSIFCSRRVPSLSARHRPLRCTPRSQS